MPDPFAVSAAAEAEAKLQEKLGHRQVKVRPRGKQMLIQMDLGDEQETIARFVALTSRTFAVDFRTTRGRWEPLPDEGTLAEMVDMVADQLGPYLMPENY